MSRADQAAGGLGTADATRLREAMMAVTRQARRHRPAHGLTMTQVALLGDLDRNGVSTVAELAERAQVKVQSLTLSMNRLEDLGLITRRTDTVDRRRQLVELTEPAVPLLEADRRQRDEWLAEAVNRLSDTERGLLMLCVPVLEKVAASAE
ncbi:MarR family winged helix-turn-helix transcriptional regulator [Williamsia muralis]|uniref:MarR family transcriptional regulator n=1 Tax=Williamsia marianensis TaxID=85044 RepID=A0A2G3PHV5_WILMA|nr:MarR family transcriptional regulator [Williamsia marianensis]PHV65397.1 MarR family transcriptional regulator [Williamsia marianensis]